MFMSQSLGLPTDSYDFVLKSMGKRVETVSNWAEITLKSLVEFKPKALRFNFIWGRLP